MPPEAKQQPVIANVAASLAQGLFPTSLCNLSTRQEKRAIGDHGCTSCGVQAWGKLGVCGVAWVGIGCGAGGGDGREGRGNGGAAGGIGMAVMVSHCTRWHALANYRAMCAYGCRRMWSSSIANGTTSPTSCPGRQTTQCLRLML